MKNIYDENDFFNKYMNMGRSKNGLLGSGEWECLEKQMPDVSGFNILDLGSGFAWHAKYFIDHGANSVDAVDSSINMQERAKEINFSEKINYIISDIEEYEIAENKYDLIFSSLVLHYIKGYKALVSKVYKGLKKGGIFLFSVEHPAFTAEGSEDFLYDEKGNIICFPLDNYFLEGERDTNFLGSKVPKYHRTLTTYISTLLETGFSLKAIMEPEVASHLRHLDEMKEEYRRPMMLIVKSEKS